jgi:hypothetical protein
MEEIKKIDLPIKTLFVIKDGAFDVGSLDELDKKNYTYRLHSRIDGVAIIDYDKTDIVPVVKDIFNRQNTFIEIKYLRFILIICGILFVFCVILVFMTYKTMSINFLAEKTEILQSINKINLQPPTNIITPTPIIQQTPIIHRNTPTILTSPTSTGNIRNSF